MAREGGESMVGHVFGVAAAAAGIVLLVGLLLMFFTNMGGALRDRWCASCLGRRTDRLRLVLGSQARAATRRLRPRLRIPNSPTLRLGVVVASAQATTWVPHESPVGRSRSERRASGATQMPVVAWLRAVFTLVMIVTCRRRGRMSEFLDDVARSLAQPMPRRRAVRVLGGALASVACRVVMPRARARRPWPDHPCAEHRASRRQVQYGRRGMHGRVLRHDRQLAEVLSVARVDHLFPNSSSCSCINKPNSGPGFRHTRSAAARRTPAAGPHCRGTTMRPVSYRAKALRPRVLRPGKRCARPPFALLQEGAGPLRPEVLLQGSCANPGASLCCTSGEQRCGRKCCHASQVCSGGTCRCTSGWRVRA